MFGQNDKHQDDNKIPDHSIDGALNDEHKSPNGSDRPTWQHPGAPLDDNQTSPSSPPTEVVKPESINDYSPSENHKPHQATDLHSSQSTNNGSIGDDLIDIKQQALGQLTPLVGHLDQTPEDKFRTTMMMIQASDDQSLIRTAYDAAQKIEDDKSRAQALLDIVNEINYFTQHQG